MLNIIVPGRFHYANYAHHLLEDKTLERIYFSHRYTEDVGVPRSVRSNLFLKEYFLRGALKVRPAISYETAVKYAHKIWRMQLSRAFSPARVNLFLLHGANLPIISMLKRQGYITIGEAVNAHPRALDRLLTGEALRLNLPSPRTPNADLIAKESELVDVILCPSRAVAESYVDNGAPSSKVIVLPYAAVTDAGSFRPEARIYPSRTPCTSRKVRMACIGQVNLRKGQHLLLDCISKLPFSLRERIELTIVGGGSGDYMSYLRANSVDFLHIAHVPHSEMHAFMQAFDVVVLSSIEDGFGLVVAESLTVGTPVLVSRYAGVSAIIREQLDGYVFDPFLASDFERAFTSLLKHYPATPGLNPRTWSDYAKELSSVVRAL